jgi:hypothetical protein
VLASYIRIKIFQWRIPGLEDVLAYVSLIN